MGEEASIVSTSATCLSEDRSRMITFDSAVTRDLASVVDCLREDSIIKVAGLEPHEADQLMQRIADFFDRKDSLQVQAAFASSLGHRKNVSDYYMSVNERGDYAIVPPHSEGSTFTDIQLASFYCYENTTDGGETLLLNVDNASQEWSKVREYMLKGHMDRLPTAAESARAKAMFRIDLEKDRLRDDDQILNKEKVNENLTLFEILAKPVTSWSVIQESRKFAYWDSISASDRDVLTFMRDLLVSKGIFKEPPLANDMQSIDWDPARRIMNSEANFYSLFESCVTHKLQPGEFVVMNNLTWTHSVNNWTPMSGTRRVSAAFA